MFYTGSCRDDTINYPGIDLHVHTSASDGMYPTDKIAEIAIMKKIMYLAITDHDTTAGMLQVENCKYRDKIPLHIIPGIELSTEIKQQEIHILGYFIDIHNKKLQDKLALLKESRVERAVNMINKLHNTGYKITMEDIKEDAGRSGSLGRPHIALALVKKGYVNSIKEAFDKLLNRGCPGYVPRLRISPYEAIELIIEAGGVPVLAHPGIGFPIELLPDCIEAGLKGIEVFYPQHSAETEELFYSLASNNDLIITGGSDFHGHDSSEWQYFGTMPVSAHTITLLKEASQNKIFY